MNSDRLSSLHLLPPQAKEVWTTHAIKSASQSIARPGHPPVQLDVPLFWYDPPWIKLPPEVAARVAASVANMDVTVSALHRDLSDDDSANELFAPIESDEAAESSASTQRFLPRMTPYRAERYGFSSLDFDETCIVDVRLSPVPDESGRLAYSPEQMRRWERTAEDSPIAGGGYVATCSFPTDIVSLGQAKNKIGQLRQLAPSAAVFVSIGCYSLEREVAVALATEPDGMIVRASQPELEGIQLAAIVRRARKLMDDQGSQGIPLWVVPGEVSAKDIAKLMALGASAVAIDAWCDPLVHLLSESLPSSRYDRKAFNEIPAVVNEHLWDEIDHVIGLNSAILPETPVPQRLGTYHSRWAKACDVSYMAP